jgi:Uma2 family endonuclease
VNGKDRDAELGRARSGFLQAILSAIFMNNRKVWGISAATDWRVQVKRSNYRVPDITVLSVGSGREPICNHPPLLTIEILSPGDRLKVMDERCQDYPAFGVPNVWIIDPQKRMGRYWKSEGLVSVQSDEFVIALRRFGLDWRSCLRNWTKCNAVVRNLKSDRQSKLSTSLV